MSNGKSKSKIRFNIVDAMIIVLVILCIVGIYFRSHITEWIGIDTDLKDYELSFKVTEIKYTSEKYFEGGAKIYLDSPNMELGTLNSGFVFSNSEKYVEKSNGSVVSVTYPPESYVDVSGIISCKGVKRASDGFYLDGSYAITPGMTLKVHTEKLDFTITVIDITEYGA